MCTFAVVKAIMPKTYKLKNMKRVIKCTGEVKEITETLTLELMQDIVGGFIEIVSSHNGMIRFVCDEEGKLKGYPINIAATQIGYENGALFGNDYFAGDVIIADSYEID